MRNLFLVYLHLSISTCFGRLEGLSSGETTVFCDSWYLLFCVDDCLVCLIPDSHPHRITSTNSHKNTVVSPDDGPFSSPKHVEIDKYTKNKLRTNLVLFTRRGESVFCSYNDIGLADETKQVPPPPFAFVYRLTPSANSAIFLQAKSKISHYIQHIYFLTVMLRPNADYGLLFLEVSRSHTTRHRR